MPKRRIEIISTLEQTVVWRLAQPVELDWCGECGAETVMLGSEAAAQISRIHPRVLDHWIRTGEVHVRPEPGRLLLVCLRSVQEARNWAVIETVS